MIFRRFRHHASGANRAAVMSFVAAAKLCHGAALMVLLSMAALSTLLPAARAQADTLLYRNLAGQVVYFDSEDPDGPLQLSPGGPTKRVGSAGIDFRVTYGDVVNGTGIGFDDPIRGEAFQGVIANILLYIDSVLLEAGAVDIQFFDSIIEPNTFALAAAGPLFSSDFQFTNGLAFERITTGSDPFRLRPEIQVQVNFGNTWFTGDGEPPDTDLDFFSVLLHEISHGLGMVSFSDADGQGPDGLPIYTVWDSVLETGGGFRLFSLSAGVPLFVGSSSDMTNGDLFFGGARAADAFGARPPIFTPLPFRPGSSLSHFGDLEGVVMGPVFGRGEAVREYAPFEIAALADLGYRVAGDEVSVTVDQSADQKDPAREEPILFDVTFSEPVSGFEASDLQDVDVRFEGTVSGARYSLSGSGADYVISVSVGGADGTVIPTIPNGVAFADDVVPNAPSKSLDNVVTYDSTPPSVRIGPPSSFEAFTTPVAYRVTYSGAVESSIDLTAESVILNRTGSANGTVEVAEEEPYVRVVTISRFVGEGTLSIGLRAGTALDEAGNEAPAVDAGEAFTVLFSGPSLEADPEVLDFGRVGVGNVAILPVTLLNRSDRALSGRATTGRPFAIHGPDIEYGLGPFESTNVRIVFTPVEGPSRGTATFSGGVGAAVALLGEGVVDEPPALEASVTDIDFGPLALGLSVTRSLLMTNVSDGAVQGTVTAGGPFTISAGETFELDPGGVQAINVRFTPRKEGVFAEEIVIAFNGEIRIPVTGESSLEGGHTCGLVIVAIASPLEGSRLVIPEGGSAAALQAVVNTFCELETEKVVFFLDGEEVGELRAPPFVLTLPDLEAGEHTLFATAFSVVRGEEMQDEVSTASSFTVAALSQADVDNNGIPDVPLEVLAMEDDVWIAQVIDEVTLASKNVGAAIIEGGLKQFEQMPLSLSLAAPDTPGGGVTVAVPRAIAAPGKTVLVLLEVATDLESLFGRSDTVELMIEKQPGSGLVEGGVYAALHVLTTNDGVTFEPVGPDRLLANRPQLSITGLQPEAEDRLALYSHGAAVEAGTAGLELLAIEDDWSQAVVSTSGLDNGTLTARILASGVYAPLVTSIRIMEGEGEGMDEGEGMPEEDGEGESGGEGETEGDDPNDGEAPGTLSCAAAHTAPGPTPGGSAQAAGDLLAMGIAFYLLASARTRRHSWSNRQACRPPLRLHQSPSWAIRRSTVRGGLPLRWFLGP